MKMVSGMTIDLFEPSSPRQSLEVILLFVHRYVRDPFSKLPHSPGG